MRQRYTYKLVPAGISTVHVYDVVLLGWNCFIYVCSGQGLEYFWEHAWVTYGRS